MTEIKINTNDLAFSDWAELNTTQLQNVLGFLVRVLVDAQTRATLESNDKFDVEGSVTSFLEDVDFAEYVTTDQLVERVVEDMDVDKLARKIWYDRDGEILDQLRDQFDASDLTESLAENLDYGELVEHFDLDELTKELIKRVDTCDDAKRVVRAVIESAIGSMPSDGLDSVLARLTALETKVSDWVAETNDKINMLKSRLRDGLRHLVGLID